MQKDSGCKFCVKARRVAKKSPCPFGKTTGAVLEKNGVIFGMGYPVCAPWGFLHGDPIKSCPYKNLESPSRLLYCNVIDAEPLSIFDALQKGYNPKKATLHLTGHWWSCRSCEALLLYYGISLCIDPYTAKTNPNCQHRSSGTMVRQKMK